MKDRYQYKTAKPGADLHAIQQTEEQRGFLERHGCRAYQGYLFSKPVPIDEFEALIRRMPN